MRAGAGARAGARAAGQVAPAPIAIAHSLSMVVDPALDGGRSSYDLRMRSSALAFFAFAVAPSIGACKADTSGEVTCGGASAPTTCERARWPRLAVGFGDLGARSLSYAFVVDGQVFAGNPYCPVDHGESAAFRCDVQFESYPAQHPLVRVDVGAADGGPVLLSVDVPLQPFNYCGSGMAYVVVTAGDAGQPTASAVSYLDVCSR